MSNFEAAVPKQIEDLLYHFLETRRDFLRPLAGQKHDIDIAKWIEFAAPVSAERNQRQRNTGALLSRCSGDRGSENIL